MEAHSYFITMESHFYRYLGLKQKLSLPLFIAEYGPCFGTVYDWSTLLFDHHFWWKQALTVPRFMDEV